MFQRLGWGGAAIAGLALVGYAAALVNVPLTLTRTAEIYPEAAPLVAPLSYLGAALITCVAAAVAIGVWTASSADREERLSRRLRGARFLTVISMLFTVLNLVVVQVVTGAGFSPGTLIFCLAGAVLGLVGVGAAWAYRANFTRRWAA